jgi:hypothetical protein
LRLSWSAWDEQIEHDFSPGGRGAALLTELEREIAEGKTAVKIPFTPHC